MKVKTTAENRKDVVKAMEEILNVKAKYQGPPSFGYKVGEYTVDRDGNVEHESEEAALTMQNELVARGLAEGETDRLNICYAIEPHFGGVRHKSPATPEMRPQCLVNQGSFCP